MDRHAFFDLLIHTDAELEALLGASLVERVTLHEWPLSCVQRLRIADGSARIYKSESGPTVEAAFYAATESPLLVKVEVMHRDSRYACLLLEHIEAPLLEACALSEKGAVEAGKGLLAGIAAIRGRPPVYLDVSRWELWQAVMDGMIEDLDRLVGSEKYTQTSREDLRRVAHAVSSADVQTAMQSDHARPGLVHHDLSGSNVFLTGDGFRVIDWQRPIFGPPEIDLVLLLSSLGFDPRPYVAPGIQTITSLLRIHWLTECAVCWFPQGFQTYDRTTAHIAQQLTFS